MKKFLITIILLFYLMPFILAIFPFIFEESNWNPFDYARITDVDYKAVVVDEPNSNGKIIVTERLTFDIHAAFKSNPFWELWRDLPEAYIDGVKVDYKVNSVKQIFENKPSVTYQESSKLYWNDYDYTNTSGGYGPGKWYHSEGPYNENLDQYECVFFYVDGLYREKVVFEIEYEMTNAALRYNDCSELYLTLYSEDTIKYLNSFKGQILLPDEDMPKSGNYEAYTYGTNSNSFPFTESKTVNPGYHTFSFELDKSQLKFRPYNEYIEFSLISYGQDKHIFTEYASRNDYYYTDVLDELREEQEKYESLPKKYAGIKFIVYLFCLACTYLVLKSLLNADDNIEKKYNFYNPTMQMQYFRDIPSNLDPHFAATLVFCKHKPPKDVGNGYAAIMLSLVRKGYIELTRINDNFSWIFSNVKIIVKHTPTPKIVIPGVLEFEPYTEDTQELEPLTLTEEHYLNLIIRHSKGSEISMSKFQSQISSDYENTDTFVKNMDNSIVNIGISQGYFQKSDYEQPKSELKVKSTLYGIIGILLLIVVNLISYQTYLDLALGGFSILGITFIFGSLLLKGLSKKYLLLTQFGEDEYVKWRGLYNFLNSETLMNERTVVELPIWEQYLIYATAFGISDKVIKALNIRCPEAIESSPILSNSYYRSRSFYSSSRSFRTATRSASYTARSGGYSGYGGHGGYGGGGRGGGGGGGGH